MSRPSLAPTAREHSAKGARTRARIVAAATAVFQELGFRDTRIADIAERAGLSHGSFYHYFDSKESVFRHVADEHEAMLTAPGGDDREQRPAANEDERIRRANRRYLERYRESGRLMAVIEEVSRYDEHVNEARMRRQKHFSDRAEESVRRLQAAGRADPGLDPAIAAVALGAMVARFAELWLVEDWASFQFDDAVDQVSRLWANAIGLTPEGVR